LLPDLWRTERRRKTRTQLEIKSLEDARQFVQIVNARNVENSSVVKAWRFAKKAAWVLLLIAALLMYYLLDLTFRAVSLP
jgi:hypothetical protein